MLSYNSVVGIAGVSEWQTRQTQNLLWATTYGFKSHRRQLNSLIGHQGVFSYYAGFYVTKMQFLPLLLPELHFIIPAHIQTSCTAHVCSALTVRLTHGFVLLTD